MPSQPDQINKNDSNYDLVVKVVSNGKPIDLSTFTSGKIIITSPSGVKKELNANLFTDGTDGRIFYTVQGGEFDMEGIWTIEASVTTSSGSRTTDQSFFVVV